MKEREKKEIQEGLIRACNVIDLIIEILRGSKDRVMAKRCLVDGITDGIKFKSVESRIMAEMLHFTERQADAILELRLYRLIGLEIDALNRDYEETTANIFRYEDILERKDSMAQVLINDLEAMKKAYARPRRTVIENGEEAVYEEKKVGEMDVVFLMDRFGYCRTIDAATYERNKEAADAENKYVVVCKNTGKLCAFTNKGTLITFKCMDLPFGRFRDKGVPIDNVSVYDSQKEDIIFVASQSELNVYRLAFVTRQAMIKYVSGGEFDVSKRSVAATKLADDDEVVCVSVLYDQSYLVLCSHKGYLLKIASDEIPMKKKAAIGVRGMKLSSGDYVEAAYFGGTFKEQTVEFHDRQIDLGSLKMGKRDGKGSLLKK